MLARRYLLIAAFVLGWMARPGFAQADQRSSEAIDPAKIVAMMTGTAPAAAEEPPAYPDFAQVTKGMVSMKGLFTLWYYPPDAKDKNPETLFGQIPASFLGEQFMLSTSYAGGGFLTGFPLDQRVVKWEILDRQLVLVEPETRFVMDKSKEVTDVVRRTYPDRIRVAVPIVTRTVAGDVVIDLGRLLKSNFADIAWTSFLGMGEGGPGGINPSLSKWTAKKTFELNVEIGVELAVGSLRPPGSFEKKLVHYSFWKLPQTDYKPRVADDRVGYFLTVNQDWSKSVSERDLFNRYIDRWHLVKRDPSLKVCEPRQPITFYIEKTVPVRYRRAVRDGILEWNKAFEKIGFINAVEVRQQTDDNEWKDLDPEDMRYSFIRWIVTGAGFAMGPHRANPFTGQIYDADIIFDDSMVRFFEHEAQQYLPSTIQDLKFADPTLAKFAEQYPSWRRPTNDWEEVNIGQIEEDMQLRKRVQERLSACGHPTCAYMEGMKHQMALGKAALAGQPPEVIDRFLYDAVKEVVTHEVGHTLGLRHNFKASSIYSLAEIKKRRATEEPTCGSIMDYNPALLFAQNAIDGHFITPAIGPYDYWAIEYGYRPVDGSYEGKKGGEKDKEKEAGKPEEGKPETPPAEAKPAEGGEKVAEAGEKKLDLSQIPPEMLEKLPPEARQMLAAGLSKSGTGGGPGQTSAKTSGGPAIPTPPAGEDAMLKEIASRASEPELAYATDEDTTFLAPDPMTNRFDMCKDPIEWARSRMELADQRLANVLEWSVKDKENWYYARQAFLTLWFEKANVLDYVGRVIGGQYFSRSHRGDGDAAAPFVLVEPAQQRAALKFIEDTLYRDDFFVVSPEIMNHMAPARWSHQGSRVSLTMDFPYYSYVAQFQWSNLFDRLFPNTLRRIRDNEVKSNAPDKLTAAEYIQRIQKAVWADTIDLKRIKSREWDDQTPLISTVRRSLQREYLGLMEPLIRNGPGTAISPDLHAMLQHCLHSLAQELATVLNATAEGNKLKLDFASQAHLSACKSRIDRMLSAELREYGDMGFGGMMFMQPTNAPAQP